MSFRTDMNIDFKEMFYQICDRKLHQNWHLTTLHPSLPESFESLMIHTGESNKSTHRSTPDQLVGTKIIKVWEGLFKASCGKTWFCILALKNPMTFPHCHLKVAPWMKKQPPPLGLQRSVVPSRPARNHELRPKVEGKKRVEKGRGWSTTGWGANN